MNKKLKTPNNSKEKRLKINGMALIELIMSMVIISIVFGSLVMAFQISIKVPSVNITTLAANIANNYLNEITGKNFPRSLPCNNNLPGAIRANYIDLCDYNNLIDHGAKDHLGNPILGLEKFTIKIEILTSNQVHLGDLHGGDSIANSNVVKINAIIDHPQIPSILISSYKGKY